MTKDEQENLKTAGCRDNKNVEQLERDEEPVEDIGDRPLTAEELEKIGDTPFWRRVRLITIIFFWVVWVAMLGLTIFVVVNAKNAPVKKKTNGTAVASSLELGSGQQLVMFARVDGAQQARVETKPTVGVPIATDSYLQNKADKPQLIMTPINTETIEALPALSDGVPLYVRTDDTKQWQEAWATTYPNLQRYYKKLTDLEKSQFCESHPKAKTAKTYFVDKSTDPVEAKFVIYSNPNKVLLSNEVADVYKADLALVKKIWAITNPRIEICKVKKCAEDAGKTCGFSLKYENVVAVNVGAA